MNITLCDLEWLEDNTRLPNIICLQLSSYLKQQGDNINFATCAEEYRMSADKKYIFRQSENTPIPLYIQPNAQNIVLVGNGFQHYRNYRVLNKVVASMRPDYLLYRSSEKKYANADYVQFFYGNELISTRQDYHNTAGDKKFVVVMDRHLWRQKKEDILWCLEELSKEKNILFYHPISLKCVIEDIDIQNAFCKLHFMPGTDFKWRNDYNQNDALDIIAFLQRVAATTRSKLGAVPFKAHLDNWSIEQDLLRCLTVINEFKKAKLQCKIIANVSSATYELLQNWTNQCFKFSYIEFVLHKQIYSSGLQWSTIINDSRHWGRSNIDPLIYLLTAEAWIPHRYLLFYQWGDKSLDMTEINYDYLNKKRSLTFNGIVR